MYTFVIFIVIVIVLITILVVRVSEISTNIKSLEKCVVYCISRDECNDIISDRMCDTVSNDTLRTLLKIGIK
jgi:hypothetical protein